MEIEKATLAALVRQLHNDGVRNKRAHPTLFHEPSYLAAAMSVLDYFRATDKAPAIWVFGPLSGKSAFTQEIISEHQPSSCNSAEA